MKLFRSFALVLIVCLAAAFLVSINLTLPIVHAAGATAYTVSTDLANSDGDPNGHQIVSLGGYWFDFYANNVNGYLDYRSSTSGSSWGSETAASPIAISVANYEDFDVMVDAGTSTIVIAYSNGTDGSAGCMSFTRTGTESGGVISWNSPVTVIGASGSTTDEGYTYLSLCNTSSYYWVGMNFYNYSVSGHPQYCDVFQSNGGSSWTTVLDASAADTGHIGCLSLTNCSMYAANSVMYVCAYYSRAYFYYNVYNFTSSAWTGEASTGYPTTGAVYGGIDSLLTYNNQADLAYIPKGAVSSGVGELYYGYFHNVTNIWQWSANATIDNGACSNPSLSATPSGLYVFYLKSGTIYNNTMTYSGNSWSTSASWISGETSPIYVTSEQYPAGSTGAGVAWVAGSSPYNERFAYYAFSSSFTASITVNTATHSWTLSPGSNNVTINENGGEISLTVTASANFDIKAEASGNLAYVGYTIPLTDTNMSASTWTAAIPLTTSYQVVPGLSNVASGSSLSESFYLWLSCPTGTPAGTYTYTLTVEVVATGT
jgi:hypothetical protein